MERYWVQLLLSEIHLRKQQEFRRFAEQEIDSSGGFPRQNLEKAGKLGYLGLPIPTEYGGAGEDFLTYILLIEEISRVCASTGVILAVHTSVGTFPILYFGSAEQREKYLPALASGRMLGAFALTEAGAGSDAAAISTTAEKVSGGYRLKGCKLFITSCGEADLYNIFATLDKSAGRRSITAFLAEKNRGGLYPGKVEEKMGLRRSQTGELQLDEMFLPDGQLLGREGEGFAIAMSLLDGGRIGIAAQGLGLAGATLDYANEWLKVCAGNGTKTDQGHAFRLADLSTRLEAARLLTYRAAQFKASGKSCTKEASMAKLYATDLAMEAATACFDLCAMKGSVSDERPARYFCDAKATQIYEGSNQIQRLVIAREMLK